MVEFMSHEVKALSNKLVCLTKIGSGGLKKNGNQQKEQNRRNSFLKNE